MRGVDHETAGVAAGPDHEPLPDDAVDAVAQDGEGVAPAGVGEEVTEEATRRAGHEGLVGALAVVKVDGLATVTPVDVAEDVEFGADAPDFLEEGWAA